MLGFAAGAAAAPRYAVLYRFQGGSDGSGPVGRLVLDQAGSIYGTTLYGVGTPYSGYGTVFRLARQRGAPNWSETVLYSFQGQPDGASPYAGVVLDKSGALYGTTQSGGTANLGTVYKLTPPSQPGQPWTETVLYSFQGGSDGSSPTGELLVDNAGALYGTTTKGGAGAACCGTAFKLTPTSDPSVWTESVIHAFTGDDGLYPGSALAWSGAGALYGTALGGGPPPEDSGTVFALTPQGSNWTSSVLFGAGGGISPPQGPLRSDPWESSMARQRPTPTFKVVASSSG
jgi:uncharacterized repeat protein (TIGR03803 family)